MLDSERDNPITRDEILTIARNMTANELYELIHDLQEIADTQDDNDLEDTPDEQILADFEEAWKQVIKGDWTGYKTAREVPAELDAEDDSM